MYTKHRIQLSALFLCAPFLIGNSFAWLGEVPGLRQPRTGIVSPSSSRRFFPLYESISINVEECDSLEKLLIEHRLGGRLIEIKDEDLPLLAEVWVDGQLSFARIRSFRRRTSSGKKERLEPKIVIESVSDGSTSVIDFGQVTTVWNNAAGDVSDLDFHKVDYEAERFPPDRVESTFDRLYRTRVGRGRVRTSSSSSLTKKQLNKLIQSTPTNRQPLYESVLRKAIKAGRGLSRLVDSNVARSLLYREGSSTSHKNKHHVLARQTAVAAKLLANEASVGGRFKRWPSVFVSSSSSSPSTKTNGPNDDVKNNENVNVESVRILNGGWLVTDQSVRAGTEARKFVERLKDNRSDKNEKKSEPFLVTQADRRILRRLECLAMGESFFTTNTNSNNNNNNDNYNVEAELERDVKDVLTCASLPLTPKGARKALIQAGHWTGKEDFSRILPWTQPILDAAAWYTERRLSMPQYYVDRVDLTNIPCVCVDAKRTAFRDDAIGIRPRFGTGRQLVSDDPKAPKWEILVHITDVSDLYVATSDNSDGREHLERLKEAAQSRGYSRYDLPLGPLHLLPPKALDALSFSAKDVGCHGAVTLWAYIDERDGRVLDAGVERTLISSPMQLSFEKATTLMDQERQLSDTPNSSSTDAKARALLLVAERILSCWNQRHRHKNEAARKREARMSRRERKSQEVVDSDVDNKNDGIIDGFQRTRGHRLVDSALDLYASIVSELLREAGAPLPIAAGADHSSRGGRVATSPLRRYLDGEAQRQVLAVLCNYGTPMTVKECRTVGKIANEARNSISNFRARKK